MKRKTAIKKLMSVGYSRNHANKLLDKKPQAVSNVQRFALLAYLGNQYNALGLPLDCISDVCFVVTHNTVRVEVLID